MVVGQAEAAVSSSVPKLVQTVRVVSPVDSQAETNLVTHHPEANLAVSPMVTKEEVSLLNNPEVLVAEAVEVVATFKCSNSLLDLRVLQVLRDRARTPKPWHQLQLPLGKYNFVPQRQEYIGYLKVTALERQARSIVTSMCIPYRLL